MSVKIIHEPSVYMVGKSSVLDIQLNQFLDDHGVGDWNTDSRNTTKLVEIAGRLCYMSFANPRPGGNKAYIEHILEVGHGSVLEHAVYSLIITGVSRSLTHELIRHRAGMSYSQLSQRYVDESDVAFVLPPAFQSAADLAERYKRIPPHELLDETNDLINEHDSFIDFLERSLDQYKRHSAFLESTSTETDKTARRKQAREAARSVLPNCTETKIFVTGNARAWRHFLELRGSIHADAEIQRLAKAVLSVLQEASPNIFGDYTITGGVITTPYRKV